MKVAKNTVVSIAYQVRTQDGVLVDEAPANQPLEYLQGHNNLIIGLENALEGNLKYVFNQKKATANTMKTWFNVYQKRYSKVLMKWWLVCVS